MESTVGQSRYGALCNVNWISFVGSLFSKEPVLLAEMGIVHPLFRSVSVATCEKKKKHHEVTVPRKEVLI